MTDLARFHRALHRWYAAHGRRDLPWRRTDDPYAIYISEIMLQQTQVKTVLERFYHPFLTRFPTLAALAAAPQQDVLHAWQGLGYYSRAVNLHRAAQAAGQTLPDQVEGLLALPGIGRNTAHAVAAFAFRRAVPVMEANVKRVLHRLFALPAASDAELWDKASALLDAQNPFDYNQAMMDVGAMICTPRQPKCDACPARPICRGKASPLAFPAPKKRKAVPTRRRRILVCADAKGRILATPRATRFLHGLYHFIELPAAETHVTVEGQSYPLSKTRHLGEVRQIYSHFVLEASIHLLTLPCAGRGNHWYSRAALNALPVSAAERAILALLKDAGKAKA